jgi:hypothetical protein
LNPVNPVHHVHFFETGFTDLGGNTMTDEVAPDTATPPKSSLPRGILFASAVCWFAGIVDILFMIYEVTSTVRESETSRLVPSIMAFNVVSGAAMCVAGYLIASLRRAGIYVLAATILAGMAFNFYLGIIRGPGTLPILALAVAAANVKHFR